MDGMREKRRARLVEMMQKKGVEAAIITSWPNIFYLSGLRPIGALTNSWQPFPLLVNAQGAMTFVCTRAFSKMMEIEYPDFSSVPFAEDHLIWPFRSIFEAMQEGLRSLGIKGKEGTRIGIETDRMPASYKDELEKLFPKAEFVNISSDVTSLRYVKDESELAALREAARITNEVGEEVIHNYLRPGMTEYELERAFIKVMAEKGAAPAFVQIFSGERSCYQNIAPTGRIIKRGDTVLMDYGVRCESGYCSDITRAAVIGKPSKAQLEISKAVKEIILSTLEYIRPGRTAADIDKYVESKFKELGYGDYYIHRTGHNVGLEPSEPFAISRANETDVVQPNMCFAIEPGIYIDGVGIRLEDNIITTETGIENLTSLPYDIISV